MSERYLLCLSSGLTPQYRLDILRLLALPTGALIQFRYGEGLIADGLRNPLAGNALTGSHVLLAHVDCNTGARRSDGTCPITPCRHAVLTRSTKIGSFFFLQYRLEEFSTCSNLDRFQVSIAGDRPHWSAMAGKNEVVGLWCFESAAGEQACGKASSLAGWQDVIAQLWRGEDFSSEPFFFTIDGLYVRGSGTALAAKGGEFVLEAEKYYELRVFHFHPKGDQLVMVGTAGLLSAVGAGGLLEQVTNPVLPVDSPYDLKTFHFRTAQAAKRGFASIIVRTEDTDGKPLAFQPELYIPVSLKPAWARTVGYALLIGTLLWMQQLISATAKGPVGWMSTVELSILALGTAYCVVFGLRKPV